MTFPYYTRPLNFRARRHTYHPFKTLAPHALAYATAVRRERARRLQRLRPLAAQRFLLTGVRALLLSGNGPG